MWSPTGPLAEQAAGGAELNININGSPYHSGKASDRERMLATRAADASCALVYVNQVCGQDELVFDGGSMVFDADGTLIARAAQFVEELLITDVDIEPVYRKRLLDPRGRRTEVEMPLVHVSRCSLGRDTHAAARCASRRGSRPDAELYEALVLGTGDYVRKNGFTDVVIGLSGGIDSTLVACIAVDALGAEHVHGVAMPVALQQRRLEDRCRRPGRGARASTSARSPSSRRSARYLDMTAESFAGNARRPHRGEPAEPHPRHHADGAVEQVRLDGADHRQQERDGRRLLHPLRRLGRWLRGHQGRAEDPGLRPVPLRTTRVAGREIISESVITKPPSAELRPDQRDDQSLPPYEVLDPILSCTSRTIAPRRRSSSSATTRRSSGGSPGWSTSTSTSAASARQACGSA